VKNFVQSESGPQYAKLLLPIEFDYLNRNACLACLPSNTSSLSNEILMQLSINHNMFNDDLNDSPKKHFTLIKTSKTSVSLLDDLKMKASHYSKTRTTKTLLNSYSQGLSSGNVIGEDLNMMSSSMNGSSKSVPYLGRFMPSKNDSKLIKPILIDISAVGTELIFSFISRLRFKSKQFIRSLLFKVVFK